MGFWDKEEETVESIKERKSRKMDRFMKMQVLPAACKFLMTGMLVLTPLAVLADVSAFWQYGTGHGLAHLLKTAAITALTMWSVPGLILLGLSIFQLYRLKNGYEERPPEELTPADFGDNNRYYDSAFAEKPKKHVPEKKYKAYSMITAVGMIVFGLCLFVVSFL